MARANRSVRLFDHVIEALAAGRQPQREFIDEVGYLMRTTAVYGSGKFGAADRESIAQRPELAAPFQAEMLTVFLIRAFTLDLVEHLAQARAPPAGGDPGAATAPAPGHRQLHGAGHGAVPAEPSGALEQLGTGP